VFSPSASRSWTSRCQTAIGCSVMRLSISPARPVSLLLGVVRAFHALFHRARGPLREIAEILHQSVAGSLFRLAQTCHFDPRDPVVADDYRAPNDRRMRRMSVGREGPDDRTTLLGDDRPGVPLRNLRSWPRLQSCERIGNILEPYPSRSAWCGR